MCTYRYIHMCIYISICMCKVVWLQQLRGQSHVLHCNACGNVVSLVEAISKNIAPLECPASPADREPATNGEAPQAASVSSFAQLLLFWVPHMLAAQLTQGSGPLAFGCSGLLSLWPVSLHLNREEWSSYESCFCTLHWIEWFWQFSCLFACVVPLLTVICSFVMFYWRTVMSVFCNVLYVQHVVCTKETSE